jgi:hypothetical protein
MRMMPTPIAPATMEAMGVVMSGSGVDVEP